MEVGGERGKGCVGSCVEGDVWWCCEGGAVRGPVGGSCGSGGYGPDAWEAVVGRSCVGAVAQHCGEAVGGSYTCGRTVAQLYRGTVCVGAVFGGAVAGSSGGLETLYPQL